MPKIYPDNTTKRIALENAPMYVSYSVKWRDIENDEEKKRDIKDEKKKNRNAFFG
jgi:hypothetical protein